MARPLVKKHDIEQAAIRLFAAKGLARVTIKDIAAAAGVTEGALYRHYPGKNEMAWALFTQELERFTIPLGDRLFAPGQAWARRLDAAIHFMYDTYRKDPVAFAFIMLTQHGFPEEDLLTEATNPNDMALRFIREAMADGAMPEGDPRPAAAMLIGLTLQPLVMHRYGRLALTEEIADQVVAAALRALELQPAA